MIKTLIIEDEMPAAERLSKMLHASGFDIEIIGILDSVSSSVEWFNKNPHPDLVMLDIQLADGRSFEIFKKIKLLSFVIFTTAYDEFALKAFELNSIDYLLKPVKQEELNKSLSKYLSVAEKININRFGINEVIDFIEKRKTSFKKRFVINIGQSIKVIESSEIAFIYSLEKNTFLCTKEGKEFPLDFSLDNLEDILDPECFFRISRQYIIHFEAINQIYILSKSRIKLEVIPASKHDFLVSSTKSSDFRKWLDR